MNQDPTTLLLIAPGSEDAGTLRALLSQDDCGPFELEHAQTLAEGLNRLAVKEPDVVLLSLELPDSPAADALARLSAKAPAAALVILADPQHRQVAIQTLDGGVQDFLIRGEIRAQSLGHCLKYAIERRRLQRELEERSRALRASELRFDNVVNKSPDGIVIVDRNGMIRFVNPAAESLLDRKVDELLGEVFGFAVGSRGVTEVEVIRRSGEKAVAELRCIETTWQGEPGYLVSLRDVTQNVQLRHALQSLSITDDLTGLYNRRGFVLLAAQQCRMAIRAKREMLLIFADMDGLKTINDTLGHPQGDGAIKDVTTVLRRVFRQSDIIARIGGDEFAVLALEVDPNSVETIRRRLNDAIEAMNRPSERPYRISISIGIARFDPRSPCSVHDLLAKADQAMYAEKQRKHASAPSNSTR